MRRRKPAAQSPRNAREGSAPRQTRAANRAGRAITIPAKETTLIADAAEPVASPRPSRRLEARRIAERPAPAPLRNVSRTAGTARRGSVSAPTIGRTRNAPKSKAVTKPAMRISRMPECRPTCCEALCSVCGSVTIIRTGKRETENGKRKPPKAPSLESVTIRLPFPVYSFTARQSVAYGRRAIDRARLIAVWSLRW